MMRMFVSRLALAVTTTLLLTVPVPDVMAQRLTTEAVKDGTVIERGRDLPYAEVLPRHLADQLARMINRRLREMSDPSQTDYTIIATAYAVASQLVPDDEEFARREVEAWTLSDKNGGIERSLRRLNALAPDDTVVQLRLINRRIRKLQDADGRLDAYNLLLGPRGQSLDPAIRSRLALDAGLLLRETGDEIGFLNYLNLSMSLDISNKDAAVLFASYINDRSDDPLERLEVLLNIVLADPLDREAYLNSAFILMSNGAHAGARRMLDLAAALTYAEGQVLDVATLFDVILTNWATDGDEACIERIDNLLVNERRNEEGRRAAILAEGLDPGPPRPIRLPPSIELLALAVHELRADEERSIATVERIDGFFQDRLVAINDPMQWPDGFTEEQVPETTISTLLEMAWIRLFSGHDLDTVDSLIEQLAEFAEQGLLEETALKRTQGWLAGRRGDFDEARAVLEPIAKEDTSASLGLAMTEESAGKTDAATRLYARLALEMPNSVVGCFARYKVERIIGKPVSFGPDARKLDDYSLGFAPWLERFVEGPHSFMSIRAEQVRSSTDLLGRSELRFVIRNVSRRTLGIGAAAPIKSRIMMAPQLKVGGYDYMGLVRPEILRIDRRLRLEPGEELDLTVWATRGALGLAMDASPEQSASLRWRVVQGFEYQEEDGSYEAGPFCVTTESDIQYRSAKRNVGDVDDVVGRLQTATEHELIEAMHIAVARIIDPPSGQPDDAPDRFFAAMTHRITELDSRERALALAVFSLTDRFTGQAGRDMVQAVSDDRSSMFLLAGALCAPQHMPAGFAEGLLDHPDEHVRRFGAALIEKLSGVRSR